MSQFAVAALGQINKDIARLTQIVERLEETVSTLEKNNGNGSNLNENNLENFKREVLESVAAQLSTSASASVSVSVSDTAVEVSKE
jgi:hypothetical protein